ncbi:hypothetical protein [Devosia sp. 1635]|uniref:hypothetical protein n=1 Tax=Devosia sp. 1635 TaxID=2726066 RepID=UPI00156793D9|nr:hypothetical protein [Devosia sp. 1635]
MTDQPTAQLRAFEGLEHSVMELRSVSLLLVLMEDQANGQKGPDGTFVRIYDSSDHLNAHAFLIFEAQRRTAALLDDVLACRALLAAGGANGHS